MPGKPYTMRELRGIVEYIKEKDAYGETKGRKMWVDFANSRRTTRTWQSLKETFLKRLLPDIHNPYYKLSPDEIYSFKSGSSLNKTDRRLEVWPMDDASKDDGDQNKSGPPSTSRNAGVGDDASGEKPTSSESDVRRDSVETVILNTDPETCYETAQDIIRVLESPGKSEKSSTNRSVRDFIEYSEPLTPKIQDIIDDFDTDDTNASGNNNEQGEQIEILTNSNKDDTIPNLPEPEPKDEKIENVNNGRMKRKILTRKKNKKRVKILKTDTNSDIMVNGSQEAEVHAGVSETEPKESGIDTKSSTNNSPGHVRNTSLPIDNTQNIGSSIESLIPNNQEAWKKNIVTNSEISNVLEKSDSSNKSNKSIEKVNEKRKSAKIIEAGTSKTLKMSADNEGHEVRDNSTNSNNQQTDINEDGNNEIAKNTKTTGKNVNNDKNKTTEIASKSTGEDNEVSNPCLQSVSLFIEQNVTADFNVGSKGKEDIVQLDTDSSNTQVNISMKECKDRQSQVFAKMFGFSNGGVSHHLKGKSTNYHNKSASYNYLRSIDSYSSSDEYYDYVSPPRRSMNRYIYPGSLDILEHEGRPVVAYKGKIYPLIKEESRNKKRSEFNHLHVPRTHSKSDNQNENRKRLEQGVSCRENDKNEHPHPNDAEDNKAKGTELAVAENQKVNVNNSKEDKSVKITIHSDNKEITLEGHWPNLAPILTEVMQMVNKNKDTVAVAKNGDDNVQRDVSKMEEEIYKEIEEIEKAAPQGSKRSSIQSLSEIRALPAITPTDKQSLTDDNSTITRRKRDRPTSENRKAITKVKQNLVERKSDHRVTRQTENEIFVNEAKLHLLEDNTRRKVVPSKYSNSKRLKSLQQKKASPHEFEDDEQMIKYKFPSPEKEPAPSTSRTSSRLSRKIMREYSESSSQNEILVLLHSDASRHSIDSSYGYQDSDGSPRLHLKKRKLSLPTKLYRQNIDSRRKSIKRHKFRCYSSTTDSSQTSRCSSFPNTENSSLNTAAYRTDSYQLLMPKKDKNTFTGTLQKIKEDSQFANSFNFERRSLNLSPAPQTVCNAAMVKVNNTDENSNSSNMSKTKVYASNSSNVSLPLSPEISVVENISVDKSRITNITLPTLNEMQANSSSNDNNYVHVSIIAKELNASQSLMNQEFDIVNIEHREEMEIENNTPVNRHDSYDLRDTSDGHTKHVRSSNMLTVTDSLINKIETVNINDPLSDSLDCKLSNLLLESSKKNKGNSSSALIEENIVSKQNAKSRTRNRCSTPHKKSTKRKSKRHSIDPLVEEHLEYCAPNKRRSCPPSIIISNDHDLHDDLEYSFEANANFNNKNKKQKKNIIKVKILKPKKRDKTEGNNVHKRRNKWSLQSDSGINNSGTDILEDSLSDSVGLIHNHSETCINANECLENSLIIMEDSSQSSISISSNSCKAGNSSIHIKECIGEDLTSDDSFSGYAQGECSTFNVQVTPPIGTTSNYKLSQSPKLISASPTSINSLLTEDLSNERTGSRASNWFLLSEDECSNTKGESNKGRNDSHFHQLFPITCAVPDLSTISEISRESESLNGFPTKSINTTKQIQVNNTEFVSTEEEFHTCS